MATATAEAGNNEEDGEEEEDVHVAESALESPARSNPAGILYTQTFTRVVCWLVEMEALMEWGSTLTSVA